MTIPVIARAALTAVGPHPAELVSRGTGPLHLHRSARPDLGDFTRSGALRARHQPVCAQPARRWYLADADGRPLCGRCAAWAAQHLDLTAAPVPVDELVDVLVHATTLADVDAVQRNAINRAITAVRVPHPDPRYGQVPLHTLLAHTRRRLTPAHVGAADRAWMQRVQSQATRFPRRIA